MADALYGLVPKEFTAARDARAKEARAAGERALAGRIAALRRPTVSAWLVNTLVRARPADVEALVALGAGLREAQAELSGADLRRLSGRRSEAVGELTREAEQLARSEGQPASAAALEEVTGTFEAALAGPEASAALREGRLTVALRYSGLGFGTAASPEATGTTSGRRAAADALSRARRDEARASASLQEAEQARRDLRERIRDAETELKDLREREAAAVRRVTEARREHSAAQALERTLQRQVGTA